MKVKELFGYSLTSCLHDSGPVVVYRGNSRVDTHASDSGRERAGAGTGNSGAVILKVVEKGHGAEEHLNQLDNEHEILKSLAALNCVPVVIDYLSSDSHVALVLEDVEANCLAELSQGNTLSITETLHIIEQCFKALDAIHQRQVIHKDIKPSNILVDPHRQQVWLIDFGLATRFNQKLDQYYHSTSIAGSLCYMPPEQTGRVNRQVDYRSDYYSLGVTAYQLLTGSLPFSTDQSDRELLYELLAKQPISPRELNPATPQVLSDMVMRLMAKDAEDRYQTMEGALYDLSHGMSEDYFELGQQDILARFLPPQKLYGRDHELETLKNAFQQVLMGEQFCVFVAGYSGVGKTALVHELYREIHDSQAVLLEGKFDLLQRNQPLYGFTKAFEDFFASILTQSDDDVAQWRQKLSDNLGENAGVVTQHIANLEHLLGVQPEPLYLAGDEGFNRLIYSFQRLIKAVASVEHPLVIFIDDLQWVDDASLKLLERIYQQDTVAYTLIVGAYRENEVLAGQPLFDFIQQANNRSLSKSTPSNSSYRSEAFRQIHLDNLAASATTQIIQAGFRYRIAQADQLAEFLHHKTAGNPFFTIQCISQLIDSGAIYIEGKKQWRFKTEQLQDLALADNVVALMSGKIAQFPQPLAELLFIAAAIGHEFSIEALQAITAEPATEIKQTLIPAIHDGLLIATRDNLRFAHDGIQTAVLAGITESDHSKLHEQIAEYLLTQYQDEPALLNKHIFDICFHLNACDLAFKRAPGEVSETAFDRTPEKAAINVPRLVQKLEQRTQLNHQAAGMARQAAAYQTACDYIAQAMENLTQLQVLQTDQDNALAFSIYRDGAECAYLVGDTQLAERYLEQASQFSANNFEQCQLMNLSIVQLIEGGDYQGSMQQGIAALELLGIALPELNDTAASDQYYQLKQSTFEQQWIGSGKTIADLYDLPLNTDPQISFTMELLGSLYASALMSYPDYLKVITITLVDLSVEYGNTLISPIAYAWHGSSVAAISDHYDDAYAFGQLAIRLNEEKVHNPIISCKLYNMVANFIAFFKEPLHQIQPVLNRAYELGLASGDKLYASYSLINEHRNLLSTGIPLEEWLKADEEVKVKLAQCDGQLMIEVRESFKSHVVRLMGHSQGISSLDNADFDEQAYREKYVAVPLFGVLLDSWKIQSSYLLGDYDNALSLSCFDITPIDGFLLGAEIRFFAALTLLRQLRLEKGGKDKSSQEQSGDNQEARQGYLQRHCTRIEVLANSCPENFAHLWNMLQGERARLNQDFQAAAGFFNQSIAGARENKFQHYEALANELLAQLFLDYQLGESAQGHLKKACSLYGAWGSSAKLNVLKDTYPELDFDETLSLQKMISSGYMEQKDILKKVDFNSLVEVSLALSSEMDLKALIDQLMTVAVEIVGAQKCLLLMPKEQAWSIAAAQHGNQKSCANPDSRALEAELPLSILNYVSRSGESLVLGDAANHKIYGTDSYITQHQTKSLSCIPLVHNGKTRAILYLENNLGKHIFNPSQTTRLELLSSQMAAAIENAENFHLLSEREQENRSLLKNLPVGILVCDKERCIRYANPLAYQLLKADEHRIIGASIKQVQGQLFDEAGNEVKGADNPINRVLNYQTQIHGEVYGYQRAGESKPSWFMTSAFPQYKGGQIERVITCIVDVTERRDNEQRIKHLAYHDELTDLPNRTYLESFVSRLIAAVQSDQAFSALIIMDIDNFKVINDSLGHWIGDKMLHQAAHRIQAAVDDDVFFARLGGDAFALLFTSLSHSLDGIKQRIEAVGRSIQSAFEMPFVLADQEIKTTLSFGVAIIPEDGDTVDTALRYADIALNHSKKGGRNKLSYFKEEHETELQRQIELEKDLNIGIEENQLSLVYQPKVDVQTGTIVGAEALVRWFHPEKGPISPVEFIPLAEDSDLIIKLGQWVLNEACRQLSLWQSHPDFTGFNRMSVNISPFQFKNPGFIKRLNRLLYQYQIKPEQLDLEVTEYLLLEQTDIVVDKLNKLRAMGITVSIDDFGTGYSSLNYLKRLPVDTLKVDQSFVFEMTESDNDRAIVQTILAMAQTLQLKTVAEGVESAEHLELLQQYNCDEYQGYFFSKPVDPVSFESLMRQSRLR